MKSSRGDAQALAAGGSARHIPVLRGEVVEALAVRRDGFYIDATFGAGGYSAAILSTAGTRILALDRDPAAIAGAAALTGALGGRLDIVQRRFGDLGGLAAERSLSAVNGIVFDIGVSSMQIDTPQRGFSFRADGPLDMRMSGTGMSAADLLAEASEAELADILYYYGEERAARRIARAIVADRMATPFSSTAQLAGLVARVAPARPGDIHPATRAFQALRIAVNDELGELYRALIAAERLLAERGRLVVVTFHSLEDRIVKTFLAQRSGRGQARSRVLPGEPELKQPSFLVPRGQPIVPAAAEIEANPRARSAKLRYALRTDAPPQGEDTGLRRLAELPGRRA